MKKLLISAAVATTLAPAAWATNGMNMEGYGPVATAMGGAAMAYDNGNAGIINNPATLGFMAPGTSRFDIAIGGLHPDVGSQGQDSSATAFYMPAFGYIRKDGNIAWGAGVMAQGGMGTDYSNSSMFGTIANFGFGSEQTTARSLRDMAQVGVGRVIFPLSISVTPELNIGGSVDFVWAGMDIKWLVDGAHFADMMPASPALAGFGFTPTQKFGQLSGSLVNTMVGFMGMGAGQISGLSWGYFDFEQGGTIKQKATATGWAGNLGFTWKASERLTIGGVYHGKTSLSDMSTGDTGANLTVNAFVNGAGNMAVPVVGKITVRNFQWPETYGLGMAFQANEQWLIAADYKRVNWASVMKNFSMSFNAAPAASQTGMAAALVGAGGTTMDMTYFQNWEDQNVFMLGAAYKYNDALTVRFGGNFANNPVPDAYVTPLFPAIETNHFMGGFGYAFDKLTSMDFSLTHAPKVTVTNNWGAAGGSNQTISHSQTNWQLMYSKRF